MRFLFLSSCALLSSHSFDNVNSWTCQPSRGMFAKDNELLKITDSNIPIFSTRLMLSLGKFLFSIVGIIGVMRCCIIMFCIILGVMKFVFVILAIVVSMAENKYRETMKYPHAQVTIVLSRISKVHIIMHQRC